LLREAEDVKVLEKTCGYGIGIANRRLHSANDDKVLDRTPLLCVQVVVAMRVDKLPYNFDWGLRPKLLLLRHIEIINEA
jgi:hypothetical protein